MLVHYLVGSASRLKQATPQGSGSLHKHTVRGCIQHLNMECRIGPFVNPKISESEKGISSTAHVVLGKADSFFCMPMLCERNCQGSFQGSLHVQSSSELLAYERSDRDDVDRGQGEDTRPLEAAQDRAAYGQALQAKKMNVRISAYIPVAALASC